MRFRWPATDPESATTAPESAKTAPSLPSKSRCASALAVSVGLVVLGTVVLGSVVAAQTRRSQPPLQQATRAILEGKYEEVDRLTDALDQRDPGVVAIRARAAIARGRYADAEAALRPVATALPTSAAALELGLLSKMLGRDEAPGLLRRVAANAPDLLVAARALRAIGEFQEANGVFRDAAARAPKDPEINTAWGELYLDAHQNADALELFQMALEADSAWTPAILGAPQALADDDPPQAAAAATKALELNPSYVEAHVFLASQALDQDRKDEARESLKKALSVNPSSLEAHAVLAAMSYVADNKAEFESEVAKVLAISPKRGEVFHVAGEFAARNYRFDEAVTLVRRALELEPQNPRALSDLGLFLLRTGDEPAARQALEASFKLDAFHKPTFNLLGMLDRLDTFVTVRDGDFIFKFDKSEVSVLQEYAIPLAHQALDSFAARYEFKPQGPILVEVFPRHDDFAVRIAGLPGMIGALGVCFGRVVALDSPKARPPGSFQWEATLWHELAHVITIQMSNQRVPRWLTEGVSEYEQKRARPEWARQMDIEFAELMVKGETIKLSDLNAAFTDPRKIGMAYFQGSVVVEHIIATYGAAGLNKLLRAYADGLDTDAALKSAVNTDFEQMQAGFDETLERRFGDLRRALSGTDEETLAKKSLEELRLIAVAEPGSYRVQMALGRALRKAGEADAAIAAFEKAAALVPLAHGNNSPHAQIAQIALEKNDRTRAIAELQSWVAADFDNVEAARELRRQMGLAGITDPAKVRAVNERIAAIDPFDAEAHTVLGRLALQRNEATTAAREFKVVLALGPLDPAAAHTDLAESYLKAGKTAEAKKETLAALEIAPTYSRAQELLLNLVESRH
jgi:cellulose synthase operon protein C